MDYKYKKILVAVDGSETSEKAFDRAVQIAKRDDAEIFIAHVIDTRHDSQIKPYIDLDELSKQSKKHGIEMLNDYEQIAKDAGVLNTKKVIKFGSPKEILLEKIIPEEKINLVILGATGINAIERVLVGSVAENIFRYANCDVLAIR